MAQGHGCRNSSEDTTDPLPCTLTQACVEGAQILPTPALQTKRTSPQPQCCPGLPLPQPPESLGPPPSVGTQESAGSVWVWDDGDQVFLLHLFQPHPS